MGSAGLWGCVVLCCLEVSNPGRNHQEKCNFGQKFRSILKAFFLLCLGFPSSWKAGKDNKINTKKSSRRAFFLHLFSLLLFFHGRQRRKRLQTGGNTLISLRGAQDVVWVAWGGVGTAGRRAAASQQGGEQRRVLDSPPNQCPFPNFPVPIGAELANLERAFPNQAFLNSEEVRVL